MTTVDYQDLQIDGVRVETYGTPSAAPPLLFVHGGCQGSWAWEKVAPRLASAGWYAVCLNWFGHYGSKVLSSHGPVVYDDGVTLQEMWAAMESLVDAGLSRAIGLSDIDVEGTRQIVFCSEAGLASPFMRERDRAHNDSRVIWGPAEGDSPLNNATLLRCLYTLVMPPDRTFQRAYSPRHKEQRVTDLMQAARALAARDGVRTVTLTAIATQAGVHVSAVRRYFESREEILLGLAEQGYAEWAQALTDRIHGRDGLTSTDLAQAVTATLVERPLFCDLLTHVTLNLEREVTYERVHTFKLTVNAILGPLQQAITGATPLTPEQTGDLVIATIALTAPLWQAAHPAETLTRLYAEEPTLAHIGIDFAPTLTRLLTALCDGMTTAHK